jgi:hypothetical protein
MVETQMRQRHLLLLQKSFFSKRPDHGPYRAFVPGRQNRKKQCGALLQKMQFRKKSPSAYGLATGRAPGK